MKDPFQESCCCSDDSDSEFELKTQVLDENNVPQKIQRRFVDIPYDQVVNGIEAAKQYAEEKPVANMIALICKAITEAWVPNQSKAAMERQREKTKIDQSEAVTKIKKQCEALLKSYERLFTRQCYFALSDNSISLVCSQGTSVLGYLEKDSMIILEYFIEKQLKRQ